MPKGTKIQWVKYKKLWAKFDGSLKEFSKKYDLVYCVVRNNLRVSEQKQRNDKKIEIIKETIGKEIEKQAEMEGLSIARIILAQNSDLEQLEKLKNLLELQIRITEDRATKKEDVIDDLKKMSEIVQKISATTKNIIEYTGQNINLKTKIDQRIVKIDIDAEELVKMYLDREK